EQLRIQQLDRRAALVTPVASACEPDLAHATPADALLERVRAEARAGPRYVVEGAGLRAREKTAGVERGDLGEKRTHLGGDFRMRGRETRQPAIPLVWLQIEGSIQIRRDATPGCCVERRRAHASDCRSTPAGVPASLVVVPEWLRAMSAPNTEHA